MITSCASCRAEDSFRREPCRTPDSRTLQLSGMPVDKLILKKGAGVEASSPAADPYSGAQSVYATG